MQMSPSALLAGDCYVTRDLRVIYIVITAEILRNEAGCAGYVTTGVTRTRPLVFWCQILSRLDQDNDQFKFIL
jgi:hypothetical protein